jgi:hypothetical protein
MPDSPIPHIVDAGPAINFLARGNERLLIAVVGGPFHAPQAVKDEVMRKAREKPEFARAKTTWEKMEKNWIRVLPSTRDGHLDQIAHLLTRSPLPALPSKAKDLGEIYVVVHATQLALAGQKTYVLIDDQGGQSLAARAQQHLAAQRRHDKTVSTLGLLTTETILRARIGSSDIPDKPTMRRIYGQLQASTVDFPASPSPTC